MHLPEPAGGAAGFEATLDRLRPEVVHVHHLAGHPLDLPARARARGARVVLTLHDAAIDCARGQLVDRAGARCPGPAVDRCRACLAPRGPLGALVPTRASVAARAEAARAVRAAVHHVLTPSPGLAARLGWTAEVLPLPLLHPVGPAPPRPPGPLAVLFLGSLIPTKGPQLLLEAWARLPAGAATLTLAGPAPPFPADPGFARRLRARAAELPGVSLPGPVAPADLPALYAAHDLLVFPSTWLENHPLVLVEAGAAGLRRLVADVPGARHVAPDARRFAPGSVASLLRALGEELPLGPARVPPRPAPSVAEHAALLLERYAPRSVSG